MACWIYIPFSSRLPEDGTPVPETCSSLSLVINFILWYIFYCILLNAFVGWYLLLIILLLLLILQSFDWLAAFYLELLQAIVFTAVQLSAAVFLATCFNPLNAELISICHLLALWGAHHILHISRVRVKWVVFVMEIKVLFRYNWTLNIT